MEQVKIVSNERSVLVRGKVTIKDKVGSFLRQYKSRGKIWRDVVVGKGGDCKTRTGCPSLLRNQEHQSEEAIFSEQGELYKNSTQTLSG